MDHTLLSTDRRYLYLDFGRCYTCNRAGNYSSILRRDNGIIIFQAIWRRSFVPDAVIIVWPGVLWYTKVPAVAKFVLC